MPGLGDEDIAGTPQDPRIKTYAGCVTKKRGPLEMAGARQ